jgi:hypothetical protein
LRSKRLLLWRKLLDSMAGLNNWFTVISYGVRSTGRHRPRQARVCGRSIQDMIKAATTTFDGTEHRLAGMVGRMLRQSGYGFHAPLAPGGLGAADRFADLVWT